jgi:hypothetical protein
MNRPSAFHRSALLALALLQLGASGGAAWADARLDAGGPRGPVHLESRSSGSCLPVHPADCILHRFLSTLGRVSRPVAIPVALLADRAAIPASRRLALSDLNKRLPDIRGPPLLS